VKLWNFELIEVIKLSGLWPRFHIKPRPNLLNNKCYLAFLNSSESGKLSIIGITREFHWTVTFFEILKKKICLKIYVTSVTIFFSRLKRLILYLIDLILHRVHSLISLFNMKYMKLVISTIYFTQKGINFLNMI